MVRLNGRVIGSSLIGQNFTRAEYFHPRPSAADYDASASAASNYGPTNQKLNDLIKVSIEQFRKEDPDYKAPIPADLVTASASGLDPDISPASAYAQAERVAQARGVSADEVRKLIAAHTLHRRLDFLGEPRVNVLELDLALDHEFARKP